MTAIGPKELALRAQREANAAATKTPSVTKNKRDNKSRAARIDALVVNHKEAFVPVESVIAKRGRGRPKKANPLSHADRQRIYRERKKGKP